MTMEQFIIAGYKLREAQKNVLRNRNKENLEQQIFWEMEFDSHLKALIKTIAKSDIMKASLHKIFE